MSTGLKSFLEKAQRVHSAMKLSLRDTALGHRARKWQTPIQGHISLEMASRVPNVISDRVESRAWDHMPGLSLKTQNQTRRATRVFQGSREWSLASGCRAPTVLGPGSRGRLQGEAATSVSPASLAQRMGRQTGWPCLPGEGQRGAHGPGEPQGSGPPPGGSWGP